MRNERIIRKTRKTIECWLKERSQAGSKRFHATFRTERNEEDGQI